MIEDEIGRSFGQFDACVSRLHVVRYKRLVDVDVVELFTESVIIVYFLTELKSKRSADTLSIVLNRWLNHMAQVTASLVDSPLIHLGHDDSLVLSREI